MNPADFAILPAEGADGFGPAENRLADKLGIALADAAECHPAPYLLNYGSCGQLQLRNSDAPAVKPLSVSFIPRHVSRGADPLIRALGRGVDHVIDATAGLGVDAFHLANAGFRVTALESHPVIHALLEDGLRRLPEMNTRVKLVKVDAVQWIAQLSSPAETVYLDPMYPARTGSAAPKKGIRLLQHLVSHDPERDRALLEVARENVTRRVVVKRPHHADPILPGKSGDTRGKLVRFDIYPPTA